MKRVFLFLVFVLAVFISQTAFAQYEQIDLSIYGMD